MKCDRPRSRSFHKQFPAGPRHPAIKGVCRRCRRKDSPITHVYHHHHHHYYLDLPDDAQRFHRSDHSITGRFSPRLSPQISTIWEPPPEYDEFPTRQDGIHDSSHDRTVAVKLPTQQEVCSYPERAELSALNLGDKVRNTRAELAELAANHEVRPGSVVTGSQGQSFSGSRPGS